MRKLIPVTAFIFMLMVPHAVSAQIQPELDTFNQERISINKKGMTFLTGWSLASVAAGGAGYFSAKEGEAKYFHQMNGMWGLINLLFGGAGLLQAYTDHKTYDFEKTIRQQSGIEKTFLFNTALDLVYVTAGFYLLQNAKTEPDKRDKYRGWGNSIIMQGGVLCLFDVVMFISHNRHGKKKLSPFLRRATFSFNGNGAGLQYRF